MEWNRDVLATLAVEADLVEIIAEGCGSGGCELNRQNLTETWRHHSLLVEFNFKEVGLSGKYVKSLRGWRDIEHIHFDSVGLVRFKARKFYLRGLDEECAISSHKLILRLIDGEASHCFSAG